MKRLRTEEDEAPSDEVTGLELAEYLVGSRGYGKRHLNGPPTRLLVSSDMDSTRHRRRRYRAKLASLFVIGNLPDHAALGASIWPD